MKKPKKKNQSTGAFKQWQDQYHKDNPVDRHRFPQVEFWSDTKWEAYKEDIQKDIRDRMGHEDLNSPLDTEIDLDNGNKDWMYTAHFSPGSMCPQTSWSQWRRI